MTDLLHDRLEALASQVEPSGLDLAAIRQRARHRAVRRRIALSAVGLVAVAGVAVTALVARPPSGSLTADRTPASTAPVPNEARLSDVLGEANPPVEMGRVTFCCQGPIRRPDSTQPGTGPYTVLPFGRDDRAMTSPELTMQPGPEMVQVNWSVVDPPMTDQEAEDLARGVVPPDPDPIPVPKSTRLASNLDGDIHSVVYLFDDVVHASAWARDGGYARTAGPAGADPVRNAARLEKIVRDLLRPQPAAVTGAVNAPVPTRKALEAALAKALPGSRISNAEEHPRAYLSPGTTAFAGRNRTGQVRAQITTDDGADVSLLWEGLDRALDADEANTLVNGLTAVDPQGDQPPAQLLHEQPVAGGDVRAYELTAPPDNTAIDAVFAWSPNGTYATLTRQAPQGGGTAAVHQLVELARLLIAASSTDGPDHGSVGPFAVTELPADFQFRSNSDERFTDPSRPGVFSHLWTGGAPNGAVIVVNVTSIGARGASAFLTNFEAHRPDATHIVVNGTSGLYLSKPNPAVLFSDGDELVQVLGTGPVGQGDLLLVARGLVRDR